MELQRGEVKNEGQTGENVILKLDPEDPDFDLEKAVCSHGLFMMAPNCWDPVTKTLARPLRITPYSSLYVCISHPWPHPSSLIISIIGASALSTVQQKTILLQVMRMLRISDKEHGIIREFHKIHPRAKELGFGRIFRSPTLFEDMVKCVLLCNCQWPRTLSMARALCELQLEFSNGSHKYDIHPKTPEKIDLTRTQPKKRKRAMRALGMFTSEVGALRVQSNCSAYFKCSNEDLNQKVACSIGLPSEMQSEYSGNFSESHSACVEVCSSKAEQVFEKEYYDQIGNFPSPEELAKLDEKYLANRCGLGYRAKRILSLAKSIVENKVSLEELEQVCNSLSPTSYDTLWQKLLAIDGFGPYTCANVLMCMGFYHKVPSDTETIRHLKQVHKRMSTLATIQNDLEDIYERYAPFQFLAFWIEIWEFYEKRFGKPSEMAWFDYPLITASKMKANDMNECLMRSGFRKYQGQ